MTGGVWFTMSMAEVCEVLGVAECTVNRWVREKKISARRGDGDCGRSARIFNRLEIEALAGDRRVFQALGPDRTKVRRAAIQRALWALKQGHEEEFRVLFAQELLKAARAVTAGTVTAQTTPTDHGKKGADSV